MIRLHEECAADGQATRFAELKHYLAGTPETDSYAEVAGRLGMSASGIKSAVFRLRQRYRDLFRAEIGNTVAMTAEIDEEIRYLFGVLRG